MSALALRLYRCAYCSDESMHTTNHTMSIYPWCKAHDGQARHEYMEDVQVVELDTSKPLPKQFEASDWWKVVQAIGRLIPADNGRRVYITSKRAQVESNAQMKRRLSHE